MRHFTQKRPRFSGWLGGNKLEHGRQIVRQFACRDVEPVLFASTNGQWYLIGWCRMRDAMRWFTVARIEQATKDSHVAILRDGGKLPVSRSGYGKLREVLGL